MVFHNGVAPILEVWRQCCKHWLQAIKVGRTDVFMLNRKNFSKGSMVCGPDPLSVWIVEPGWVVVDSHLGGPSHLHAIHVLRAFNVPRVLRLRGPQAAPFHTAPPFWPPCWFLIARSGIGR